MRVITIGSGQSYTDAADVADCSKVDTTYSKISFNVTETGGLDGFEELYRKTQKSFGNYTRTKSQFDSLYNRTEATRDTLFGIYEEVIFKNEQNLFHLTCK